MFNVNPFAWTRPATALPSAPSTTASPPEVPADLVVLREVVLHSAESWSKKSMHDMHGHGTWGDTPFALTISSSGRPNTPMYVRGTVGDCKLDVTLDNKSSYSDRSFRMRGTETAPDGTSQDVRGEWYVNNHAVENDTSGKFVNQCRVGDSELSGKGKVQRIEHAIEDLYKHPETLTQGEALQAWQDQNIPYVAREQGCLKTPEHSEPFSALTSLNYTFTGAPLHIQERCILGPALFDNKVDGSECEFGTLQGKAFGKPLTFIQETSPLSPS